MTQASLPETSDVGAGSIFGPRHFTQLLALIAIGISGGLFWYASRWMDVPDEPHFRGSLLQPAAAVGGLIAMLLVLAVSTVIGDFIVGRRWFLGGLFVATSGLAALAIRGGAIQPALLRADTAGSGHNIFLVLLVEHLILMAAVAGLWNWLWTKRRPVAPKINSADASKEESRSNGAAILAQIGATLVLVLILLVETGVKKQVLVGVFLACMAGSAIAQTFFATEQSGRWFWIGPAVAGVVGYVIAFLQPAGLEIGHLSGFFAPLSRALPLDYASLGCAGALLGYWVNLPEEEPDQVKTEH